VAKVTEEKRKPNFKDSAIMLLKTHIEKMSLLGSAIMFMKTKGLFHSCHHMYQNK
jgi:hypothetical protein